jgi:predicted NBD/HSP70 family sugar kinase
LGVITCIEAGGSGSQTVVFADEGEPSVRPGAEAPAGSTLLLAVPGVIVQGRVTASNLGWLDADPAAQLGCPSPAALVMNDGEAAALGESVLRGGIDLVFVGVGTGVGGAVVLDGRVAAGNLFGHAKGFSDHPCTCTQVGCLETVAAGWALPDPLTDDAVDVVAAALARAVDAEPAATPDLVVVGGGLARRYPALVTAAGAALPGRTVQPTHAPAGAKSAAAWGLVHAALDEGIVPA